MPARSRSAGYDAILVGETLVTSGDPAARHRRTHRLNVHDE